MKKTAAKTAAKPAAEKAAAKPASGKSSIYQLKVVLTGSNPEIWRRILIRGDATLDVLHGVLQLAMGWTNIHIHQFDLDGDQYGPRDPDVEDLKDETKMTVAKALPKAGASLLYVYDLGAGWDHELTAEKVSASDPRCPGTAVCLEGERACPPEDTDGMTGYEDFLRAVGSGEGGEELEQAGGSFDPDAFEADDVNRLLRKLK